MRYCLLSAASSRRWLIELTSMRDKRDYVTRICEREYDRQIKAATDWRRVHALNRTIPFIGGRYELRKHDEHMAKVHRALAAQAWHAMTGPSWAQPLLLREEECESAIHNECPGVKLWGYFGRSMRWNDWNIERHPPFDTFCSGVMEHIFGPPEIKMDKALLQMYPPRKLEGLKCSPLTWRPPKE
jgi:hypothetical protein